ncbi:WXG100-like domain-containing protein [Streptomyces lunaelactis]|nr:nucleic acid/nucleotide deaminase domain-containing protein [Streptomyces lunaelactis]
MKLPDDLVEVLNLVGVDWPQIDEDEVKGSAKDYRNLAEGVRDAVREGNDACSHIVGGRSKGETVTAIDRRWGKLTTRDLATFAKGCDDLAGALDECADLILGCKIAIIADLTTAAAAATAGVVGMFFTFGASGLLSAAAIGIARVAVHEAIDYAISEITSIVTEKIESKILAEIEKLFTDRLGGGGTYDVMAPGNADMAQGLVIEFDEFDRASGDYRKTADNFDKKKGSFKEGGGNRKSSVKKDSRFHKLATVMDKAEDAVDKKADEMVKTLEEHGGKIDKSKSGHKEEDERRKREFEKCKNGGGDDEVRTYLLNADGSVQRLYEDGRTNSLDDADKSRLNGVVLNNGKAWIPDTPKEKSEFYADATHPGRAPSRKIDFDSKDDLVQATQAARIARDDYKGTNYAAGRYIDPGTGKESILVGYSNKNGHSERMIGRPLIHNGKEDGLTEVFTEREPCRKNPQCARWLDYYFKNDLNVTHVADYYKPNGTTTNAEHTRYLDYLKQAHGK